MVDAIYSPEPLENKPEWFNGFIRLEKHHKEKYNWYRYVYIPDYYSENYCEDPDVFSESRFGHITPSKEGCEFIDVSAVKYYENTETKIFGASNKIEMGGRNVGNCILFNAATDKEEQHRYLYANNDFIFRQLETYDRPQIKEILVLCSKELGRFHSMAETVIMLNNGLLVGAFNKQGEMKAIGSFIISKDYVAPEPMFYINPDARGQGMWNIYNDYTIELGLAVEAEYVFAQCLASNEPMVGIYTANGYIRDEKIKEGGKDGLTHYYTWKYPLKTKQQSFF